MEQLTRENAYVGLRVIVSDRTPNSNLVGKIGPIRDIIGNTVIIQCLPIDIGLLMDRFDIIDGQVIPIATVSPEIILISDQDWLLLIQLLSPTNSKFSQL